ncbi:Vaculolar membrane protein-domain-containing protein [Leucosporidium creatinivorum]|uniref:Vaculolar membrane protein-domain-containing protein n=1 Tax=Leucosporidium creatinivorum TaxID=106004 RepID=A0A1Y2FAQ5_9BASI|nr:Vaculolar membrane protein-domain-containing protein [Leucosporidium creatinivorum]
MDDLIPTTISNATLPLVAITAEVDPETCQLLGPVALGVQALMGLIVMGSLVLKRAQEKPKRKWRVWSGDVGKQVVGQAFVHASNVLISDLIARHKADNPCSLYALNIAIDTTLGVLVLFGFLKLSTRLLVHYHPTYRTGDYGNPFSSAIWARQAAVYVACLGAMKVVVLLLFWAFPALFKFANWCLSWLPTDDAQVVFVMLIFPLVMNLFQFLTIDSILKSKSPLSSAFLDTPHPDDDGESRRGFLEPSSDDLDDDDDEDFDDEGMPAKGRKGLGLGAGVGEGDSGYAVSPESREREEGFDAASGRGGGGDRTPSRSSTRMRDDGDRTPRASVAFNANGGGGGHSYPPTLPSSSSNTPSTTPRPSPNPATKRLSSYGAADVSPPATPFAPASVSPPPSFRSLDPLSEKPASSYPASSPSTSDNEKSISLSHPPPQAPSITSLRRDSTASDVSEEGEGDDGWGADWGASMTSLEFVREVEELERDSKGSSVVGGAAGKGGSGEGEEVDVGDDWGFEAEEEAEEREVVERPTPQARKVRVD